MSLPATFWRQPERQVLILLPAMMIGEQHQPVRHESFPHDVEQDGFRSFPICATDRRKYRAR